MKEKAKTTWYVEPLDSHTNKIIANLLLSISELSENFQMLDSLGEHRNVYHLKSYELVSRLKKDRLNLSLKFNIFTKKGKYGKLRLWRF